MTNGKELAVIKNEILPMSAGPFHATETGLVIRDEEVPFEAWQAYGAGIRRVDGAIRWIKGDWLNYGECTYGETYTQGLALWPETAYQSLANCKWISARIEFSRRRENLSFEHHGVVAALESRLQDYWLTLAAESGWTLQELRERVHQKALGGPEKELTLLDKGTTALKDFSAILHLVGSPRDKKEAKLHLAYVGRFIKVLEETLAGARDLVEFLEEKSK